MGGSAFASLSPPLRTPRMPLAIYSYVLDKTHTLLKQYYRHVRSPIEAPGKDTYGDIDILVFEPLIPGVPALSSNEAATYLATLLEAKKWIVEKGNATMNFAIPWPKEANIPASFPDPEPQDPKFIQIDLKICSSLQIFNWELFHAAHGDLWNILRSMIRIFGLTVNDKGMWLRIPDIEPFDRKKSMVFLTDEPGRILEFLGLEESKWWKSFGDREEMFEYAAGCRMFWLKEIDEEAEVGGEDGDGEAIVNGPEGGEKGKKKLKHSDRQRMAKRPIFREWMEDFIPKCRSEGKFIDGPKVTREQIRDEAFVTFDDEVQAIYQSKLKEWRLVRHTDELWRSVIKGSVPVEGVDPQFRAAAIRTLKGVIMEGELFEGKKPKAAKTDEEGFYDVDAVKAFVENNWRTAGEMGWKRPQERVLETMKVKAEKKARLQEEDDTRKRQKIIADENF